MARRPKQKLTKLEKIERDIRLAYLKQERALKAIEKGNRDLMASAKALARGNASRRRLEARASDELVKAAAPPPPPPAPETTPAPKPKEELVIFDGLLGKPKAKPPTESPLTRIRKRKASRKAGQNGFEVGNQVRVTDAPDATIFEVVRLGPNTQVFIRQEGLAPNGKPYAEQEFDTSLLKHAVTDEMLQAFSWGKLKAGRKTKLSV